MQYIELEAIKTFWGKTKEIRSIRFSSIEQHYEVKGNGLKKKIIFKKTSGKRIDRAEG